MTGRVPRIADYAGVCPSTGKRRYMDKAVAKRIGKRHRAGNTLRPYRCDHCGTWHLGHLAEDVIAGRKGRDIYRRPA